MMYIVTWVRRLPSLPPLPSHSLPLFLSPLPLLQIFLGLHSLSFSFYRLNSFSHSSFSLPTFPYVLSLALFLFTVSSSTIILNLFFLLIHIPQLPPLISSPSSPLNSSLILSRENGK